MPQLWVQPAEWQLLGERCFSWQSLLGLTEERCCLGVRNTSFLVPLREKRGIELRGVKTGVILCVILGGGNRKAGKNVDQVRDRCVVTCEWRSPLLLALPWVVPSRPNEFRLLSQKGQQQWLNPQTALEKSVALGHPIGLGRARWDSGQSRVQCWIPSVDKALSFFPVSTNTPEKPLCFAQ